MSDYRGTPDENVYVAHGKRKRKRGPGQQARNAERSIVHLLGLVETWSSQRRDALAEGGHPNIVAASDAALDTLYERLRLQRRKLYDLGYPEGSPFIRAVDQGMADIMAVRSRGARKGEVPNTVLGSSRAGAS